MRSVGRVLAAVLLAVLIAACLPAPVACASEPEPSARTVVVILAPYLTWDDITSSEMPRTRAMGQTGSSGNMNVRSSARFASELTPTHIALTMSAGAPSAIDPAAPAAFDVSATFGSATAADVYRRSMGVPVGSAEIVYLGLPRVLRANEDRALQGIPGALGQTIEDAGGMTAALGNSDGGMRGGEPVRSRPAAVLAMDLDGRVRLGDVSAAMLEEDLMAPFGVKTDIERLASAYKQVLMQMRVSGGPGMVVIDVGDCERAYRYAPDASPAVAESQRRQAARAVDAVVGFVLQDLPEDAVAMLVSNGQAPPNSGPSGFGPAIVSGPGFQEGMLSSSSTHRPGLVTDLDVAASVLTVLGQQRPVSVRGNPMTFTAEEGSFDSRVQGLKAMNDAAVAVDTVRLPVQTAYIAVTVAALIACAALLGRMRRFRDTWGRRTGTFFRKLILLLLCIPVSATLMYVVVPYPRSPATVVLLFCGTALVVWAAALLVEHRWGSAMALSAVGFTSAAVLLVDQLFGAPLSFSGLFSYSPLLGARYYGLGNEGASIVVGGALVGLALLIDANRDAKWARPLRAWGPALAGVAVVFISAAPFLGANIGVIAWGTTAFGLMWLYLNDKRMTFGWLMLGVVIVLAFVAGFSIYDLVSGGAQTHLGRAWESAGAGGAIELWRIIVRKAETNWRVLRATNWSILLVATLGFLGYMRWRPHGLFADTLAAYPAFATAMTASLWGGLVGYLTEDSGIVIPALIMLYITGSLLNLMLVSFVDGHEGAG